MSAEEIVRALAECPSPQEWELGGCLLCGMIPAGYWESCEHHANCPWLMARMWVTSNPRKES